MMLLNLVCLLTAALAVLCRMSLVNAKQCPNNECALADNNNNNSSSHNELHAQQQQQLRLQPVAGEMKQHKTVEPAKRIKRHEHDGPQHAQQQLLTAQLNLQWQQRRQQQQREQQRQNNAALDLVQEEAESLLDSDSDETEDDLEGSRLMLGVRNEFEPFDFANLQLQQQLQRHIADNMASNSNNGNENDDDGDDNNNTNNSNKNKKNYNNSYKMHSNDVSNGRRAVTAAAIAAAISSSKYHSEKQQQQPTAHKRKQENQNVSDDFLLQLSALNEPERWLAGAAFGAGERNNNNNDDGAADGDDDDDDNSAKDNDNVVNGQPEFGTIALQRRRLPFARDALAGDFANNAIDNATADDADNAAGSVDELETDLPYGIQNVRKRKSVEHHRGITYQSLCPTKRKPIPLETPGYEYRPNQYIEVTCAHNYGNNHYHHHDGSFNKICSEAGFSCIQLNRTIHLIRRQKASTMDCWESEIRIVPSGCECMWPKHNFGDIVAYHDVHKRYMPQANEETTDYQAGYGYLQIPRESAHNTATVEGIGYDTYNAY